MSSRSSYGRLNKRVKVTHRMTPYDVVVRSVILNNNGEQPSQIDTESRNILEGEVLMEKDTDRSLYLSNHRHVHSSQNAWTFEAENNDNGLKSKVENLRYAGISVTGFDARHGQYQQGFMSTIGGLNSIMNSGDKALLAGKEVYVVPTKAANMTNIVGVPRNKNLFATVHDDSGLFKDAAEQAIGNPRPDDVSPQTAVNLANQQTWDRQAVQKLRKFCIGTCLRGGRKNQLVDVVLHSSANTIFVE